MAETAADPATVRRMAAFMGDDPASRFRPPGTVLGAPEIFTTVIPMENISWARITSLGVGILRAGYDEPAEVIATVFEQVGTADPTSTHACHTDHQKPAI